ncbi:hypothetical protein LSH36_788g02009 [Paralvinella palmiformis]|uniref:Uncharacterized protein n=1 Tax=Paralvinella palmiformis TaxID=53620 RepID=A0AAD9J0Z7_9ANNE|nr:hypothetical protein LSH36_788g02009 [Paralvinella palmiformis]
MNASVLVTFTIVMVTAFGVGYRSLLREGYGTAETQRGVFLPDFPKIENEEKKDIDEINRRQVLPQLSLFELYRMGTPLSESEVTKVRAAGADLLSATGAARRSASTDGRLLTSDSDRGVSIWYILSRASCCESTGKRENLDQSGINGEFDC